jgi:4-amino-4-deoxy-L-arabinose transferase-like glycosyltransferase
MANGAIGPGEYLFQLPLYVAGGAGAVILFQIILSVFSIVCVYQIAAMLLPWRRAALVCGLVYALLPQNLVFPHQFVTEAIATPCTVFFLYFLVRSLRDNRLTLALVGALFYGLAIFVRPSLVLALPLLVVLPVLYASGSRRAAAIGCSAIGAMAFLPLAIWIAAFTVTTGKFGYTSGVANLAWNLRSKIYLVYYRNNITDLPPEVAKFNGYSQFYTDHGGVSTQRFLAIAAQHPIMFVRDAVMNSAIVLGRGNLTKLMIDYFGIAKDTNIKTLPRVFRGEMAVLAETIRSNIDSIVVLVAEMIFSVVTASVVFVSVGFLFFALVQPSKVMDRLGVPSFFFVLTAGTILFAVVASGLIVDQAQARLRNPAEAGLVILFAYATRIKHLTMTEQANAA